MLRDLPNLRLFLLEYSDLDLYSLQMHNFYKGQKQFENDKGLDVV